jgi:uncharacterized protein (TIGR02147 family)
MLETAVPSRPQILDYKDYRQFLHDYYHFKKALRAGFSFRRFSQMVGLSSPNYLQLVIQRKRNLSDEMAGRVAKTLGLLGPEKRYFVALVSHENAKTEESREQAQAEILRSVKDLVAKEIPKAKLHVLTEWYHLVVRELVLLPDFEPSGDWISRKMRGAISLSEAERSLNFLLKSGFLKLEGTRWMQADPVLDTGNAFDEIVGLKYHSNTLEAWAKALPASDKDHRELGVLTIPIAVEKIPELKQRMRKFQDEIIGWLQDEKNPERILQLGLYLIPTTK